MPRRLASILKPLVAGLLAIALAVVGAIVGTRLATPEEVVIAEVVEATVAPAIPVEALPESLETDDDVAAFVATLPPSGPVVEVPLGFDAEGAAEEFDALMGDVETASDPVAAAAEVFPHSGLLPPADPCVADPETCPAGILSIVQGLRRLEGVPDVRIVRAGVPETGAGWGSSCRRTDGAPVFVVETNRPVTGELAFWPRDDRSLMSRALIETSGADDTDWTALYVLGDEGDPVPTILHCLPLTFRADGVHDATLYVSADGRSVTLTTQFDSSGELSIPPSAIFTPFEDVITAIVAHRADETVLYELHTISGGRESEHPRCDARRDVDDDLGIRAQGEPRPWSVPVGVLVDRNQDPAYTERLTASWSVGEGTTTLVCARVVLTSDPTQQTRLVSAVVSTRDLPLPVVSIWAISSQSPLPLVVTGYTGNGERCGRWTSRVYDRRVMNSPIVICDFSGLIGSAGVESPSVGREVPLSGGYLDRYTFSFAPEDDPTDRTIGTIDLAEIVDCADASCPPPGDSYHSIVDPESGSMLVMKVSWTTGTGENGASRTTVGSFAERETEAAFPTYPWLEPIHTTLTRHPTGRGAILTFPMYTVGPARYVVRVVAAPGQDFCVYDDLWLTPDEFTGVTEASGPLELSSETVIVFENLCPGAGYDVQVILTDVAPPEGEQLESSIWGATPDVEGAPAGAFYGGDWPSSRPTPSIGNRRLRVAYSVLGVGDLDPDRGHPSPFYVDLDIDGRDAVTRVAVCPEVVGEFTDGPVATAAAWNWDTIHVSGSLQPLINCPGPAGAVLEAPSLPPMTFAFDVSVDDVVAASGSPTGPLSVTVYRDLALGIDPFTGETLTARVPMMTVWISYV